MNEKILRFAVRCDDFRKLFDTYHPNGETVLNRTEWRGKEPRSCAVTNVNSLPHPVGSPVTARVEVTYRPKGCITFTETTKYDGWTAVMLDRKRDGTLLDGKGQPLIEGNPKVYLQFEAYKDVEFNEIDFGEFLSEVDSEGVKKIAFSEILDQLKSSQSFSMSSDTTFVAPHRKRPPTKIMISNAPSGVHESAGRRLISINNDTPHAEQVLLDTITDVMIGFMEGRLSISNASYGDVVFVQLSKALVDCTPNEYGLSSWFDCLKNYIPVDFMEELAKRLMALFEIEASVVEGEELGLLLKRTTSKQAV